MRNMLGRAGHWGITWQTARLAFVEMMLGIAPNFDQLHDVQVVLKLEWLDQSRAMLSLKQKVIADDWTASGIVVNDLPLFVMPDQIGASSLSQTASALPVALGDRIGDADPYSIANAALSLANALDLDAVPDAGLVVAAWRLFYGEQFHDKSVYPWLADVFDGKRSAAQIVGMLKFRIRLDHGRFV